MFKTALVKIPPTLDIGGTKLLPGFGDYCVNVISVISWVNGGTTDYDYDPACDFRITQGSVKQFENGGAFGQDPFNQNIGLNFPGIVGPWTKSQENYRTYSPGAPVVIYRINGLAATQGDGKYYFYICYSLFSLNV